ncbi:MAG TPA: outer membrane beta-barrel protein [Ignavibacteria bacterium]|nr:outer membrane beta-barrel protein [Ignavibacteria bacterium]HMR40409.1 outer membrane beta-barrel protein [Ignavibacteria bacterium]
MKNLKWTLVFTAILFSLIVLSISENSFAQLKNLGIKGGLNLSNARLDYTNFGDAEYDSKTGFNVYLFYDFLNYKNVIISGEMGYNQKGFNQTVSTAAQGGIPAINYTLYNRLGYFDINALARFILPGSSVSPYISVGPVLSIKTSNSSSSSGSDLDTLVVNAANNLFGQLKSPVLGIIGGMGIQINKVIPQTIILEVRYNADLTNSFKNSGLNYVRNYLWQFNLGIKI